MNKNIVIGLIIIMVIVSFIIIGWIYFRSKASLLNDDSININESKINSANVQNYKKDEELSEIKIKLRINNKEITATLEDNSSSNALLEKLKTEKISIDMKDYAGFEKVGSLGFFIPTNDKKYTTRPGDIILYQGNQLTIYYGTNTWDFTKLGEIDNISQNELKELLGSGNVKVEIYR